MTEFFGSMSNSATRKTLKERIPEIEEVVEVTPEQEPLTSAGVEEASRSQNEMRRIATKTH